MAEYEELHAELERLAERMTASGIRSNALAEASLACLQAAHVAWSAIRTGTAQEALHATRAASLAVRFAMFENHAA